MVVAFPSPMTSCHITNTKLHVRCVEDLQRDSINWSGEHEHCGLVCYFYPRYTIVSHLQTGLKIIVLDLMRVCSFKLTLVLSHCLPRTLSPAQVFKELWLSQTQITTGFMVRKASWCSWISLSCVMAVGTGWLTKSERTA